MEKKYKVLGLMSGSSLDGLDMAYCEFTISKEQTITAWELLQAETLPFSADWEEKLKKAPHLSGKALAKLDADLGKHFGFHSLLFIDRHEIEPHFIASHGHTVFHYPNENFTLQIGSGSAITAVTGFSTIDNFRLQDVILGGQGAPLAPMVDYHLFGEYDICLNLGGIANLTIKKDNNYIAFDIGGANQVLNELVKPMGWPYDDGGCFAAVGKLREDLLKTVDALKFFQTTYPKSLGNDWVQEKLLPIYEKYDAPIEDKLHTACIQLSRQIAKDLLPILSSDGKYRMLVTGGGALNDFLVKCIQEACQQKIELIIPETDIIEYKEAILMALLGVLRMENMATTFISVTGARKESVGGALYQGWRVGEKETG